MATLRQEVAKYYQEFLQLPSDTANRVRAKARAQLTYIAVAMFVAIPTLRSKAIRLLKIDKEGEPQVLALGLDGASHVHSVTVQAGPAEIKFTGPGSYKTWDSLGDMTIPVPSFFAEHIREFVREGREVLLDGKANDHLLVQEKTPANEAIDAGTFSKFFKRCAQRVTKKKLHAHLIRDIAGLMSYFKVSQ